MNTGGEAVSIDTNDLGEVNVLPPSKLWLYSIPSPATVPSVSSPTQTRRMVSPPPPRRGPKEGRESVEIRIGAFHVAPQVFVWELEWGALRSEHAIRAAVAWRARRHNDLVRSISEHRTITTSPLALAFINYMEKKADSQRGIFWAV